MSQEERQVDAKIPGEAGKAKPARIFNRLFLTGAMVWVVRCQVGFFWNWGLVLLLVHFMVEAMCSDLSTEFDHVAGVTQNRQNTLFKLRQTQLTWVWVRAFWTLSVLR